MSLADRRQEVADYLTAALDGVTVHPYRPAGVRKGTTAWVQVTNVDTQDCTYGEVRVQYEVVLPVASDQAGFERGYDRYAVPLIAACGELGRDLSVRPYTELLDAATLLCVVATLTTEART